MNQPKPKDVSGETEEMIRLVVRESTSVQKIERESGKGPELSSVRYYVRTGKCKMPSYLCVKNELYAIWKLVLRGDRILIPKSLQKTAHEEHQGIVKTKSRLRTKVWWPKLDIGSEKLCASCQGCHVVGQFSPLEPIMRTGLPIGTLAGYCNRPNGSNANGRKFAGRGGLL